jgi:hypothetical protein
MILKICTVVFDGLLCCGTAILQAIQTQSGHTKQSMPAVCAKSNPTQIRLAKCQLVTSAWVVLWS